MSRYKSFSFGELPDFANPTEYCDEYEHLFDMVEKKHICSLTEPEDRTFGRDLEPIIELLNKMSATITQQQLSADAKASTLPDGNVR